MNERQDQLADLWKARRTKLNESLEFLSRDSVQFWEDTGSGRVDIKETMRQVLLRNIATYDQMIRATEAASR